MSRDTTESPRDEIDALAGQIAPSASLLLSPDETPGSNAGLPTDELGKRFSIDDDDNDGDEDGSSDSDALIPPPQSNSPPQRQPSDGASVTSNRSIQSKKGESTAKLTKLSAKTTKIMSDYQAYLQEIETEFPPGSSDDDRSASSASLKAAKNEVRRNSNSGGNATYGASNFEEGMIKFRSGSSSVGSGGGGGDYNTNYARKYSNSYGEGGSVSAASRESLHGAMDRCEEGGGFILEAIQEPLARAWDYSKSITFARNDDTNTNNTRFDDGITDITDYESQMQLARGQSYTHPWFHSRRVKRGVCGLLAIVVLIGLSVGITNHSKNKDMDQLLGEDIVFGSEEPEEELVAEAVPVEEKEGGGNILGDPLWKNYPGKNSNNEKYETAAMQYKPIEFNREKGWDGQTYTEALIFCGTKPGYGICPYDAICPDGQDKEPLGSYKEWGVDADEEGWSWVPVSDNQNEWVQVGSKDQCIQYSHMHGTSPSWGVDGEYNEAGTRNIMCCLGPQIGEIMEIVEAEEQQERFGAMSFNRDTGYTGQSFHDAVKFCNVIEEGYDLCPYEFICPKGPDYEPFGGMRPSGSYDDIHDNGAWVPILNSINEWVQVGEGNDPCVAYSHTHPDRPDWGMTGNHNEEITREVMCCIDQTDGDYFEKAVAYETAIAKYHPHLFDGSEWKGQTFIDAIDFCEGIEGYNLCPYEAICPLGPASEPVCSYQGEITTGTDAGEGVWAPVIDTGNEWVRLSEGEGACVQYSHLYKDPPEWGLSDADGKDISTFVLCCAEPGMFDPDAVLEPPVEPIVHPETGGVSKPVEVPPPSASVELPTHTDDEIQLYQNAAVKYVPKWYNRDKGYEGTTYGDAVKFCAGANEGYEICPLVAICPLGIDSEPLGGFREEPNGSYAPIDDAIDVWVQISGDFSPGPCGVHTDKNADPKYDPRNGLEELTRHIACCKIQDGIPITSVANVAAKEAEEAEAQVSETIPETPVVSATTEPTLPETPITIDTQDANYAAQVYKTVSETYSPQWFDRDSGWAGTTQVEAFDFCLDFDAKMLCPYTALCPLGRDTQPLGGYKDNTWIPIMDTPNEWVQLGEDDSCARYSHLHPGLPAWGTEGGNEEQTRSIACCTIPTPEPTHMPTKPPTPRPTALPTASPTMKPTKSPSSSPTFKPTNPPTPPPTQPPTFSDVHYYEVMAESYHPKWFDRDSGWEGSTYLEGLNFCARQNSMIPCPYLAYCPVGRRGIPLGDVKHDGVSWAPVIDSPNAWVQVGEEDTCTLYTDLFSSPPAWGLSGSAKDLTSDIMCCLEEPLKPGAPQETDKVDQLQPFTPQEQTVLDVFKAQWFGRDDGYAGTTYTEAELFCNNVAGMKLCPLAAYCPNGPINELGGKPLFLQLPAFEGEQWSPVAPVNHEDDTYVLTGTMNGNPTSTCHTFRHFNDGKPPQWGIDGSEPEKKKYTLCCKDPSYISQGISNPAVDLSIGSPAITDAQMAQEGFNVEEAIGVELNPRWYEWNGGSYSDAAAFCADFNNRQLCPFAAYCPHGQGQPISGGHTTDISAEGMQWAPVFGHDNHWVMVGTKNGNSATTCFSHEDLEGNAPSWGLSAEMPEFKRHIMCCMP